MAGLSLPTAGRDGWEGERQYPDRVTAGGAAHSGCISMSNSQPHPRGYRIPLGRWCLIGGPTPSRSSILTHVVSSPTSGRNGSWMKYSEVVQGSVDATHVEPSIRSPSPGGSSIPAAHRRCLVSSTLLSRYTVAYGSPGLCEEVCALFTSFDVLVKSH
jgi:hypothetical protein